MKLKVTVQGVSYEVEVEVLDAGEGASLGTSLPHLQNPAASNHPIAPAPVAAPAQAPRNTESSNDAITSPVAGTVVKIKCKIGDHIEQNQPVIVIEAMKMDTSITAPRAGVVTEILVSASDTVQEGQTLVSLK